MPSRPRSASVILRNLGPKSAKALAAAGISTREELERLGAVAAYARVKAHDPQFASLNLLWALAAGLEGRDWRSLTRPEKDALLAALKALP
jgi:DNA transformation protein